MEIREKQSKISTKIGDFSVGRFLKKVFKKFSEVKGIEITTKIGDFSVGFWKKVFENLWVGKR